MGLFDWLRGLFTHKTVEEMDMDGLEDARRRAQTKKAEAQLRLARERDKGWPDVLRIDKYEREVEAYDESLGGITEEIRKRGGYVPPSQA